MTALKHVLTVGLMCAAVAAQAGPVEDIMMKGGDRLKAAGMEFEVLATPGHTPGGVSLYLKDHGVVFTGDTLFHIEVSRVVAGEVASLSLDGMARNDGLIPLADDGQSHRVALRLEA